LGIQDSRIQRLAKQRMAASGWLLAVSAPHFTGGRYSRLAKQRMAASGWLLAVSAPHFTGWGYSRFKNSRLAKNPTTACGQMPKASGQF